MIKCIAVDHNPQSLKVTEEYLNNIPFIELVKTFQDPFDAIEFLGKEPVDLLFTEIDMPILDGIQLINSLVRKPMVVIITANEKYAVEAFRLNVLDYIVKPAVSSK